MELSWDGKLYLFSEQARLEIIIIRLLRQKLPS